MEKEHKISQYADDTTLVLDGTPNLLFAALDNVNFFSTSSWLRSTAQKQNSFGLAQNKTKNWHCWAVTSSIFKIKSSQIYNYQNILYNDI